MVALPQALRELWRGTWVDSLALILVVGAVAAFFQKWVLDRRLRNTHYHGLADLLIYVHKPIAQGTPSSWVIHGLVSFLLALAGGVAGAEGVAIEWMQAIQMQVDSFSVKWFEQRRRTYVASIVAAAVGAAFGAPFAGLLLTFELGIGGRSLTAATSAMSAFLSYRWLSYHYSVPQIELHGVLPHFNLLDWRDWGGFLGVGCLAGVFGTGLMFMTRYTRESLSMLFRSADWLRVLVAIGLLFLVRWVSGQFHLPAEALMEQALWAKLSFRQLILISLSEFLTVCLLIGGVGSLGWMWPALSLGSVLGCCLLQVFAPGVVNLYGAAGLAGAVSFWAVLLNGPLSGAILAFELTQDFQFVLPVWVIGTLAIRIRDLLGVRPLLEYDLRARGQALFMGRSMGVMDSLMVKDAMVSDYSWVFQSESQAAVHARASQSLYPFLPVVDREGRFRGLLTTDLILFEAAPDRAEGVIAGKVLEAKDLVYRFGVKTPVVRPSDPLKTALPWFDEFPCIPVLGDDEKLQGLLFVSHVRLVYEREVGRRSFHFVPKETNE